MLAPARTGWPGQDNYEIQVSGRDQQHQIFPSIDLNLSPEWEFNFGVGLTPATEHLIAKLILGRRFGSSQD